MQFDPAQLAALSAVLRSGSFELAAADLSVTPSAISQRIKALEDRAGAALVQRGVPCTPTSAGARLAQHADAVALLEASLLRDLNAHAGTANPSVRIAVNADSLASWFIPALDPTLKLLFDVVIDDQDHSVDWLKRGDVSAAVTSHAKPVAGCASTPLGSLRYIATASPAFADRWFATGVTAESLSQAPVMAFNAKDRLQSQWIAQTAGHKVTPPTHLLPSTQAFVDAALTGLGWGMNPLPLVEDHLRAGRLVALVPDAPLDVPLYWQVSRILQPPLIPLFKAVRRAARASLL